MKKSLVMIAALAMLGGAGYGGYTYFMKPAEAAITEEKVPEPAAHGEEHGTQTSYVELPTIILPVIGDDGVSQVVSLVISLEVKDAAAVDQIKEIIPRLSDAYLEDMYGSLNERGVLRNGMIQIPLIKQRLTSISKRVAGEDKVKSVLLQVVSQRPL